MDEPSPVLMPWGEAVEGEWTIGDILAKPQGPSWQGPDLADQSGPDLADQSGAVASAEWFSPVLEAPPPLAVPWPAGAEARSGAPVDAWESFSLLRR